MSLMSFGLDNTELSDSIIKYSDIIIHSQDLENENISVFRKISHICRNSELFLKFLKITKLWDQLVFLNFHEACFHILINIERTKILQLFYRASDKNSTFYQSLNSINPESNSTLDLFQNPSQIDRLFPQVIDNILLPYKNISQTISDDLIDFFNEFFTESLEIFKFSQNELQLIKLNAKTISMDKFSLITKYKIREVYTVYISLAISYHRKSNQNISRNLSSLYFNFFNVLHSFSSLINVSTTDDFLSCLNLIIENLEANSYIDQALDLATSFKNFDQMIRICVTHNRFTLLENYKNKFRDDNFERKYNQWLLSHKHWNILAQQLDNQNIDSMFHNIPQLSWVYYMKENDPIKAQNSLSHLAVNENNLFFQKTYCALFRILELYQNSEPDPVISYLLSKIDYQDTKTKPKDQYWTQAVSEASLPLRTLLFEKLFNKNTIMNVEIVLKAFKLIAESNDLSFEELVTLVWAAVVLVDPYLKYSDTIMMSSCQTNSFFYQCLTAVYKDGFTSEFYSDCLCTNISQFLNLHLEESRPDSFDKRMSCVFEIFQDTTLNDQ
ncbi:hypothetical protein RF11_04557 [Thelohanellus kitauei]|uniref:Uncharacterized protein n=1 Tax=Thelohanellus kitauei TaxID=669202 RepID=A0A0C2MKF6_THEKT|nr:hypothetical protein RF11_04557 [Thelohanellus kitauei]